MIQIQFSQKIGNLTDKCHEYMYQSYTNGLLEHPRIMQINVWLYMMKNGEQNDKDPVRIGCQPVEYPAGDKENDKIRNDDHYSGK